MANEAFANFRLDRVREGGELAPFVPEQWACRDLINDPPVHVGRHPDTPVPPHMTLLGSTYRVETEGVGYGGIMIERLVDDTGAVEVATIVAANSAKVVELKPGAYNLKVM